MEIVATTMEAMVESEQLYPVSLFAHYQAFCAVVILYTYSIKNKYKDSAFWFKYFHGAE